MATCEKIIRTGDVKTSLEFLITECVEADDGTKSRVIVPLVDMAAVDPIIIRFRKDDADEDADKTTIDKPGVIYTGGTNGNGTDGIAQYITESGFLVDADDGNLEAFAIVKFLDGSEFESDIVKFKVKANY